MQHKKVSLSSSLLCIWKGNLALPVWNPLIWRTSLEKCVWILALLSPRWGRVNEEQQVCMCEDVCVHLCVFESKLNEHKLIWPECLMHTHTQRKPGAQCWFCSVGKLMRKGVKRRRGIPLPWLQGRGPRWRAGLTLTGNKYMHTHTHWWDHLVLQTGNCEACFFVDWYKSSYTHTLHTMKEKFCPLVDK